MPTATLTNKGQVTIPKQVRDRLRVTKGDELEFVLDQDGSVRLRPLPRSVRELAGFLYRPGLETVALEEMAESVVDQAAEDNERIRRGG